MALLCNLEARYLNLDGKRTSIALESIFWKVAERQAKAVSMDWRQWVQHELKVPHKGRASALRVAILKAVTK